MPQNETIIKSFRLTTQLLSTAITISHAPKTAV